MLIIAAIFFIFAFPLYHVAMKLGTSKSDRFKEKHFTGAVNDPGKHL